MHKTELFFPYGDFLQTDVIGVIALSPGKRGGTGREGRRSAPADLHLKLSRTASERSSTSHPLLACFVIPNHCVALSENQL